MKLSLIVAMSPNGVIGKGGGLPWGRIPEDMANFRRLTMGKPCIMGRKTFESLVSPLQGRKNIVLGRSIIRGLEGVCVVRTPAEAIVEAFDAHGTEEAFVIGGGEIYRLFAPLCDEMHITTMRGSIPGDVSFPTRLIDSTWEAVEETPWPPRACYTRYRRMAASRPPTNARPWR